MRKYRVGVRFKFVSLQVNGIGGEFVIKSASQLMRLLEARKA
jgi:hypothetical protein